MTITAVRPRVAHRPTRREPVVDLVRAISVVVVVMLHTMMVGVTLTPDGITVTNALENEPWFAPTTWVLQVMPLFFIAGGYSGLSLWRKMRGRGATGLDFARARIERLIVPTAALVVGVGGALAALSLTPIPAEWLAEVSFRISQPLWFVAVYVMVSSLVPLMAALHDRAPAATIGALTIAAFAVDGVRAATGIDAIGAFNYLFVWLAIQQLGFFYLDGTARRMSRRTALALLAGAFAGLVVLTSAFGYPADLLLDANNPATAALIVLGIGQLAVLRIAHPKLVRWQRQRAVGYLGNWVSARSMTIYLWHMPVVVVLTTGILFVTRSTPQLLGAEWWATRPGFVLLVLAATVPVVGLLKGFETALPRATSTGVLPGLRSRAMASLAVAAAAASVALLLFVGFSPLWGAITSVALAGVALTAARVATAPASRAALRRAGRVAEAIG